MEAIMKDLLPLWSAGMAQGNFCKVVIYGMARWPSYSTWIIPGTVTNIERARS
jgi:hypothetical protein